MAAVGLPVGRADESVLAVETDLDDFLGLEDLDPEAFGLAAEPIGELGAADPLRETGEVVEEFGDAGLTADTGPLDDEGLDPLAGGVEGGGQTGGTAADDGQIVERVHVAGLESEFLGELGVRGLDQGAAVGEDDHRDDVLAVVGLLDDGETSGIGVDFHKVVLDAMLAEESFDPLTVAAPVRSVHRRAHACSLSGPRRSCFSR